MDSAEDMVQSAGLAKLLVAMDILGGSETA